MISGLIQGVGTGLLFAPLSTLAYATLDQSHRVEGTIVSTMARSLGSSVGISAVQAMVIRDSALARTVLTGGIDPSSPLVRNVLPPFMDPTKLSGLQILNGEITRQAAMIGYVDIFAWMTLLICLLIPLLFLLRPAPPAAVRPRVEAHGD